MTPRRIQNFLLAQAEHAAGATELLSLPSKLTIEATNVCNLRCPACPTGVGRQGRPRGHFSVERFAALLSELGPTLLEVELHNWGEPLLGKHTFTLVEMAAALGISTTISTNFSVPFDDERAERLVASGLSSLGVSIDGATQATYERYRARGDLERVLDNCRRVVDAKRRLGSATPSLHFGYHVFEHNAHEVEAARALAEELGMHFTAARAWVIGEDDSATQNFRYAWGEGFPDRCRFLWFQAIVHPDGGVAPCCGTFYAEDDFDRFAVPDTAAGARPFRSIWNGAHFVAARRFFEERSGSADERRLVCFDCPETRNFEGWKQALRTHDPTFRQTSSNALFNYLWNRVPESALVTLKRKARD